MLQSQLKQSNTNVPESQPINSTVNDYSERQSRDSYQSSSNKPDYHQSSYSQSKSGTAIPYRHEAPAPVKYASSNGSQPQKLDPIIRVKNFAPSASYKEIRTFLQGVQIEHDGINRAVIVWQIATVSASPKICREKVVLSLGKWYLKHAAAKR